MAVSNWSKNQMVRPIELVYHWGDSWNIDIKRIQFLYYGYDKKEYYAMRRAGKSEEEIEKLAAARDKAKAEADAAAAEEAKKHTVEYLLEEIKTLLEKQSEK